jgi:hypothetical protein
MMLWFYICRYSSVLVHVQDHEGSFFRSCSGNHPDADTGRDPIRWDNLQRLLDQYVHDGSRLFLQGSPYIYTFWYRDR